MNGLTCKICFQLYTQSTSPRLLPCGHTCCTQCLINILQDNKSCFMCREQLPNDYVGEYKVNYSLMEACEEFSSSPWNIDALRHRLESLCKEHKIILSSAKEVARIFMGNMSKISSMESDENKILELIGKEDDEINGKEAHKSLDAIEKLMTEVEASFPVKNEQILSFKTSYDLRDFADHTEFLTKIYNEVGKGQKIESLCLINGERKAARISINDNVLLLHTFRPSPEDKIAKHAEFSDLKKCLLQYPIYAFLNLTYTDAGVNHRIFIENFSQSILILKFLKLCTGESGPSYLNSGFVLPGNELGKSVYCCERNSDSDYSEEEYERPNPNGQLRLDHITQAASLNIVGDQFAQKQECEEQYHDYISKLTHDFENSVLSKEKYYLAAKTNGTLRICNIQGNDLQGWTVIGSLFGDTSKIAQKFQSTKKGIVVDCGIAVML